jgi:alpha-ketoglutarate-dependent taurine dioxygenase
LVPSFLMMLHAVELPRGRDTQFANMVLATLASRRPVDRRCAASIAGGEPASGSRPASEAEIRERPPVEYPLVRTHPDTGEKAL